MATTCFQLLQLKSFQHIRLVAGKNGLYRKLSWPHICVMPSISQWLHGGELLFITGSSFEADENTLMMLVRESVQLKLAGIVLLVGGESKLTITDTLRNYADENEFPLFEMPWDLKLVDVIQEISEMIIAQKELGDTKQRFFFELLFSAERTKKYEHLTALYGIPAREFLAIAILHPGSAQESNLPDLLYKLSYHQALNYDLPGTTLITAKHVGNIICLIMADSEKSARKLCATLEHFSSNYVPKYYDSGALKLAFSSIAPSSTSVQVLYNEATMALRIITHSHTTTNSDSLYYDQLGIYKLFFNVPDAELDAFCQEQLGPLLQEDDTSNSNLVDTLRCYLFSGGNALQSAQQLFIHKNTLTYRLNRIKSLLNVDLSEPSVRNSLYNALLISDVFCAEHQSSM